MREDFLCLIIFAVCFFAVVGVLGNLAVYLGDI